MFGFIRSIFSNSSEPMIDTTPSVNIDGTPMCGGIDIRGNPFGVTSNEDIFLHDSSMSMFDDSHCCGYGSNMFDDTFSSCSGSMLDD
jgi:hypothetical protein